MRQCIVIAQALFLSLYTAGNKWFCWTVLSIGTVQKKIQITNKLSTQNFGRLFMTSSNTASKSSDGAC